jgi:hypothetical protein
MAAGLPKQARDMVSHPASWASASRIFFGQEDDLMKPKKRIVGICALIISGVLLWAYSAVRAEEGSIMFGAVVAQGKGDLVKEAGAGLTNICSSGVGWDILMPDGRHFDESALSYVDRMVVDAQRNGLKILFRLRTGGGSAFSFQKIQRPEDYPVDVTEYSDNGPTRGYKDGEYLGPQEKGIDRVSTNFPPKILTDDRPGNTSPWYDFCYAIASRYNGTTPDPQNPGRYLPRIDYFSTSGEVDTKKYWYGTSTDYYGRLDEKGTAIGLLPTLYRAVKAANPQAKIIEGGLVSYNVGWYLVYDMARQQGGVNSRVLEYNNRYFKYCGLHTFLLPEHLSSWLSSPLVERSRVFFDKCLASSRFWDIFAFHSYEDYLMHDTIRFIKRKLAEYGIDKPVWGREVGVTYDTFPPTPESERRAAALLLKKFVSSFAEGVASCAVSPFIALGGPIELTNPGLYSSGLELYRALNPRESLSSLQEKFGTQLLASFTLLTRSLSGTSIDRYVLNREAALYIFTNGPSNKRVVIGWTEDPADQIEIGDYLAQWEPQRITVFDFLGSVKGSTIPNRLSQEPVVILLDGVREGAYGVPLELSAFVGDKVVLDGQFHGTSWGASRQSLQFRWEQISGPAVDLEVTDSPTTSFVARETGSYRFSLSVSDGGLLDEVHTFVVSVHPKTGLINCASSDPEGATLPNGAVNLAIVLNPALLIMMRRVLKRHRGPARAARRRSVFKL